MSYRSNTGQMHSIKTQYSTSSSWLPSSNIASRSLGRLWLFSKPTVPLTSSDLRPVDHELMAEQKSSAWPSNRTSIADHDGASYEIWSASASSLHQPSRARHLPKPERTHGTPCLSVTNILFFLPALVLACQLGYHVRPLPLVMPLFFVRPDLQSATIPTGTADYRVPDAWSAEQSHYYKFALSQVAPALIPPSPSGSMALTNLTLNHFLSSSTETLDRAITAEQRAAGHIVINVAPMILRDKQANQTELDTTPLHEAIATAGKDFNVTIGLLSDVLRLLDQVAEASRTRVEEEEKHRRELQEQDQKLQGVSIWQRVGHLGELFGSAVAHGKEWWIGTGSQVQARYYRRHLWWVLELKNKVGARMATLKAFQQTLRALCDRIAGTLDAESWNGIVHALCGAATEDLYGLPLEELCEED